MQPIVICELKELSNEKSQESKLYAINSFSDFYYLSLLRSS